MPTYEERLEQAWIDCLKMWKWIDRNINTAKHELSLTKIAHVSEFKRWYLAKHDKIKPLTHHCYFCHFQATEASKHNGPRLYHEGLIMHCPGCPGNLVDPEFNCERGATWYSDPHEFYKRLCRLNTERKRK